MFKLGDRVRVKADAPTGPIWLDRGNCPSHYRGTAGTVVRSTVVGLPPAYVCVQFDATNWGWQCVHTEDLELVEAAPAQTGRDWKPSSITGAAYTAGWLYDPGASGLSYYGDTTDSQPDESTANPQEGERVVAELGGELTRATDRIDALERQVAEFAMLQAPGPTPSPLARRIERVLTDRVGSVLVGYLATLATLVGAAALLCR